MKRHSHYCAGLALLLALSPVASEGVQAAEVFCVDAAAPANKRAEWSEASDFDGTVWNQKGTEDLPRFSFMPAPDGELNWPSGIKLGLFWKTPPHLLDGVPENTRESLEKLQYVSVTFTPATNEETAVISFDRTAVKLTDTGEFREELNQTWSYELRASDDCQVLSGHITMIKEGKPKDVLTMTVSFIRTE